MSKEAAQATQIFEMLRAVCEEAGLKPGKMDEKQTGGTEEEFCFGLPILKRVGEKMSNLVAPSGRHVGWLGYEKRKGQDETNLTIYLYCGSETAKADMLRKAQDASAVVGSDAENVVEIKNDPASALGDQEWFDKTLKRLRT